MAQRRLDVPEIGQILVIKRRGSRNIRLSVNSSGAIRVTMPKWLPTATAVKFVQKNQVWLKQLLPANTLQVIKNGSKIGRWHIVVAQPLNSAKPSTTVRTTNYKIIVKTNLSINQPIIQERLVTAAQKALLSEALEILPPRLDLLSRQLNLKYNGLKIRKLTSKWGSCSNRKNITLSYFLVQLPDELIDYVLLHELAHTRFHNHGRDFWEFMEANNPRVKQLRKQIKTYRPRVEPW